MIYAAESGSNSQISDFFDALYFGLTTLTTVGFGDITPVTPVGRLIVSASTVVGIALVPLQLTLLNPCPKTSFHRHRVQISELESSIG